MTLQELKDIVNVLRPLVAEAHQATQELAFLFNDIDAQLNSNFATAINVDAFVALYAPIYTAKLTRIETATDALNTDLLH